MRFSLEIWDNCCLIKSLPACSPRLLSVCYFRRHLEPREISILAGTREYYGISEWKNISNTRNYYSEMLLDFLFCFIFTSMYGRQRLGLYLPFLVSHNSQHAHLLLSPTNAPGTAPLLLSMFLFEGDDLPFPPVKPQSISESKQGGDETRKLVQFQTWLFMHDNITLDKQCFLSTSLSKQWYVNCISLQTALGDTLFCTTIQNNCLLASFCSWGTIISCLPLSVVKLLNINTESLTQMYTCSSASFSC